jgi:hypothetical protein
MHRVELKARLLSCPICPATAFLMHRVELKASTAVEEMFARGVPNAPCGVESQEFLSGGNA